MNALRDWFRARGSSQPTAPESQPRGGTKASSWRKPDATTQHTLPSTDLNFELTRKSIKRLYLRIKSPDGRVMVSAPHRVPLKQIYALLIERQDWIRQHQTRLRQTALAQPSEPMGHGTTIHCLGQSLTLHLAASARSNRAEVDAGILRLHRREATPTPEQIQLGLNQHLREILQQTLDARASAWAQRIGVVPSFIGIKRMKTRWGSCNTRDRRIWLNLELARMPVECIDLVLVHEMVHLHERHHNARFYALMDQYLPDWRRWQSELQRYGMAGL